MARVKHYDDSCAVYHVTARTRGGAFHLASVRDKQVLLQAMDFYRRRADCRLFGFVIMDNHTHLVIRPRPGLALSEFADRFKTWTSRHNSAKRAGTTLWERRYDDNAVRDEPELRDVIAYIHNNPVRAGLVQRAEDYTWSSIHNYLEDGHALIEIDTDW